MPLICADYPDAILSECCLAFLICSISGPLSSQDRPPLIALLVPRPLYTTFIKKFMVLQRGYHPARRLNKMK